MQVGFLQDDFHAFPLQIMYIDLHPPCLRCSFHLLHLFFVFSLIYVCVDGNLGSNQRNEPCQPSDIITLKVQWSFRCWWASGSWTTAWERDLDDRSRTRKFPGGGRKQQHWLPYWDFYRCFFFSDGDDIILRIWWLSMNSETMNFHGRSFWTASWGRVLMFF